jgi:hypothetical protein
MTKSLAFIALVSAMSTPFWLLGAVTGFDAESEERTSGQRLLGVMWAVWHVIPLVQAHRPARWTQGRLASSQLALGAADLVFGVLFVVAFSRTSSIQAPRPWRPRAEQPA